MVMIKMKTFYIVERLEQLQTEEREDVEEDQHDVILGDRELYQSGMELMNMLILHF